MVIFASEGPSFGGKDGWGTKLLQHLQFAEAEWGSILEEVMQMWALKIE